MQHRRPSFSCHSRLLRTSHQGGGCKAVARSPGATCNIDPVPLHVMKRQADTLAPFIALVFNKSITNGVFPDAFKNTTITPLLKKTRLDINDLKNFRPVSNLSFLSKILEKVVCGRMVAHLEATDAMPRTQSAYRRHHSTETELLNVLNDINTAIHSGQVTALCLLDLSAEFDTVDRCILLDRLEKTFGFIGRTIEWLHTYLEIHKMHRCIL